ncbi:MAG: hypothetical protein H7222_12410 [Methylotenera sp.]|nr:hypothetical protein [Oligoflexia bacterium]
MNAEKASTLKLLKEGMGKTVQVLESRGGDGVHEVRAYLPDCSETSIIPILFLLTSLAFLEAGPGEDTLSDEYAEIDGWTPADFLSHLRFEDGELRVSLNRIRGRAVYTQASLSYLGNLTLRTRARGQSATRWLSYVQGRSHLQEV